MVLHNAVVLRGALWASMRTYGCLQVAKEE